MAYTAVTAARFRKEAGSPAEKLATEFALIDTEIDLNKSQYIDLTIDLGTDTAKVTSGIDLASGSDITKYGFFFPVNVTLVMMHDYLNEAYVKEASDAKIEVYDEADAKLFGRTLTAAGEAVKTHTQTAPEAAAVNVAAGTGFYLKVSHTDASSGTGHATVILEVQQR